MYVTLELALDVVLVVEDYALVGDGDEDLLARLAGEVVYAVEYVVV